MLPGAKFPGSCIRRESVQESRRFYASMNDTALFGLTMLVVGMGGTLLTLALTALIIRGLTAIFPVEKPDDGKGQRP